MEQSSVSTSQPSTQETSGLTVLSLLKKAFSITDVLLRVLGLMTLADGAIAWTGVYRRPVEFYAAMVSTGSASLERLVGVHVSRPWSIYLPMAIVFFIGLNIACRQVYGVTLIWNALVNAPRVVAEKLQPGVVRRLIVRLLFTLWGAICLAASLILGPAAVLAPAVGILAYFLVASSFVLLMTLLGTSLALHTAIFVFVVFGFLWLGAFLGSVTADQELGANARRYAQDVWRGLRQVLGIIPLTWEGAIMAWKSLAVEAWQGFIGGPWRARRFGLFKTQIAVALSVVVMFALLSSTQALRKVVGLP